MRAAAPHTLSSHTRAKSAALCALSGISRIKVSTRFSGFAWVHGGACECECR